MAPHVPSVLVALLSATYLAAAQETTSVSGLTWAPTPLVSLHFPRPTDAPQKVWPDDGPVYARGPQTGYNRCNSTTEGPNSLCQTAYFNGLGDFCIWAPTKPDSVVGNIEGEAVAWCTKKGYGTRIITEDTILGAQVLKSNDYWMITGRIDQTKLYIQKGDYGGELDSGAQDGRGNPIGALMYTNAFAGEVYQANWWTEFIGNDMFCIKICNPSSSKQSGYCQHTLDRIGLAYNCPSKYTIGGGSEVGDFEVCDTDNMEIPGIYTDAAGATHSYAQPPESEGPITTIPYQPTLVASRNCQKTASSAIFTELAAATSTAASSASSGSSTSGASGSSSRTTGAATTKSTGSASGSSAPASTSAAGDGNGSVRLAVGGTLMALFGASVFAILL